MPRLSRRSALYRLVWRWHFIAGLLVLPFMLLLAITGGLYLFKDELDRAIYRAWDEIPAHSARPLPRSVIVSRVQAATGSEVLQITEPARTTQALRIVLRMPDGEARMAFVDPYDARVIGTTRFGGVMQIVRKVHSLQYFGPVASWLIETAAGWSIILVGTGVFLWWPRGDRGGVISVRGVVRQRIFWRDVHAVTGAFTGAVVLFLAVTGMPWSDVWGNKVQEWATATGTGRPEPPADVVPEWTLEAAVRPSIGTNGHHEDVNRALPWALEKAAPPQSDSNLKRAPIDIDAALATFTSAQLSLPYSVMLPQGPRGAYMGTYSPDRIEDVRIIYLDQYNGQILEDVRYQHFGPAAKVIEWGIAVHQGQEYGWINRYVMLLGCIAIVALAVSAVTMWWKRRPQGSLGVPPQPDDPRVGRGLIAIMVLVGILYPLVGVSLIAAIVIDGTISAIRRARGRSGAAQ